MPLDPKKAYGCYSDPSNKLILGFRAPEAIYTKLVNELGLILITDTLMPKTIFPGVSDARKFFGRIQVTFQRSSSEKATALVICARTHMASATAQENGLIGQKFRTFTIIDANYPRDRRYV